MIEKIDKAYKLVTSRGTLTVGLISLAFLLMQQCSLTDDLKYESQVNKNNYLAVQDSVRVLTNKSGELLYEISALQKTSDEIREENSELLEKLNIERDKSPEVITEIQIVYRDTSSGQTENDYQMVDSTGFVDLVHNPDVGENNSLKIGVKIPYSISLLDSIPVNFGNYEIQMEQSLDISSVLWRNPDDGRLYYRFYTDFPGIQINKIKAVDLSDRSTSEALVDARKEFGLGLSLGYGIQFNNGSYGFGPYFGIGFTYQPKYFQFGNR